MWILCSGNYHRNDDGPMMMYNRNTQTELAPDLRISRIVTGLWQIADMERDQQSLDLDLTAQNMKAYVDAGLTTFDMADHYGSAEEISGIFTKKYAGDDDVQLLTKWVPEPGGSSRDTVRQAVHRSLDRLQTDQLDLLQYHAWNYADPSYLDELFCLQELRDEGLIRHLGLTNFDTAHLSIVLETGITVVSNQVCFSLLDQRAANEMTRLCEERGVAILAFGTLAGGFLTEKWLDRPEPAMEDLSTWSQMKYKRYIDEAGGWVPFQNLLTALKHTADAHEVSMANVASRFILEQPAVGSVIIGARLGESEHIENNRALLGFTPKEEDWDSIRKATNELVAIPGDCGDEYRKPPFLTATGDLSHHIDALPQPYPTISGPDGRTQALSGTVWEDLAGFSRAVKKGNRIMVSGTTATHGDKVIGGQDPGAQAHFVIDKIEGALQSLGGRLEDVVRTRIYIRNIDDWEPVSRAHGQRFGHIQPANTLVQAGLIGNDYRVEMEVEAIVQK
jgi:aryl-alcohol dehydrogenase-like predicted oxidoreductase/enamine deaminase RidA (YjgF/YER057c/UK114 family)